MASLALPGEDNVGGFDFALVNAPAVTFVAGIVLRWLLYRVDAAREKQARKAAEADEAGAPSRAAAKLERRCRRAAQHLHLTTLALGLVVGWSYEEVATRASYDDARGEREIAGRDAGHLPAGHRGRAAGRAGAADLAQGGRRGEPRARGPLRRQDFPRESGSDRRAS